MCSKNVEEAPYRDAVRSPPTGAACGHDAVRRRRNGIPSEEHKMGALCQRFVQTIRDKET